MNLLTYPDVINLMGDDLDWTEALGHAVTSQQPDVLEAIQIFRRKAQAAGNLKSDDKQIIVVKQETIQIVPAKAEIISVPAYQPAIVVVAQPAPVVTYAPTAYPVYYSRTASSSGQRQATTSSSQFGTSKTTRSSSGAYSQPPPYSVILLDEVRETLARLGRVESSGRLSPLPLLPSSNRTCGFPASGFLASFSS